LIIVSISRTSNGRFVLYLAKYANMVDANKVMHPQHLPNRFNRHPDPDPD